MSLRGSRVGGLAAFATLLLGLGLSTAEAQDEDRKTPFYDTSEEEESDGTHFAGSITSSNFFYSESAAASPGGSDGNGPPVENASRHDRIFTDLRLKLAADHIGGGNFYFKADVRGRFNLQKCKERIGAGNQVDTSCLNTQSGSVYSAQERDLREFHLRYRGENYDFGIGRQFAREVAALKYDGISVEQHKNPKLKFMGFAGLFPFRGSRDIGQDYPLYAPDPMTPDQSERVMPVIGGGAASYRREGLYGSVGAAAIVPRANDRDAMGLAEKTRILLTSSGYWQQSEKTDIHHYIVFDVAGAAGAGVSNITLGVNHRPSNAIGLFAQLNRVDTEVLNVHAQTRLEDVDPNNGEMSLLNNWYVSRVAQESARAGATIAFSERRFQLTASGDLRRRPQIDVRRNNQELVSIPTAQNLDANLSFTDRRSVGGFRIGGNLTRSFVVGDSGVDRSTFLYGRVQASKELADDKGEYELFASYLQSVDESLEQNCGPGENDSLLCYGRSKSGTIGVGGNVFYRPASKWFAMGTASVASQTLQSDNVPNADPGPGSQPAILMLTAFARLGYRF